jgi:hypothetical protein
MMRKTKGIYKFYLENRITRDAEMIKALFIETLHHSSAHNREIFGSKRF